MRHATVTSRPAARSSSPATGLARATRPCRAPSRLTPAERLRLAELCAEPVDFMDSPEFRKAGAERRIFDEAPEIARPDVSWYRPLMDERSRAREMARPGRAPATVLLTAAQERVLFLKLNYARFRLAKLQRKATRQDLTVDESREALRWADIAKAIREQIAETNLALVLAMAKRLRGTDLDFGDLISEGNMALLRSVDKFDCGRGFKFSTYACRAILKAFSRHGIKTMKHRQRFPTEFDPEFERSDHLATVRATSERESAQEVRFVVESNRADLSELERSVISQRFGFDGPFGPRNPTLEEVGETIGLTKERVRQIQNRALEKIRSALLEIRSPDAKLGHGETAGLGISAN
jgi:RNA polymerase primary sigma factor